MLWISLEVIVWGYVSYSFEQIPALVFVYISILRVFFFSVFFVFFYQFFSLNYVLMSAMVDGIFFCFKSFLLLNSCRKGCVNDDCCFLLSVRHDF